MGTLIAYLTDLDARLDGTIAKAKEAERALLAVSSGVEAAAPTFEVAHSGLTSLSSTLATIDATVGDVGEQVASISGTATDAAGAVAAAVTSIGTSTQTVGDHADRMSERLRRLEQETTETVARLQDYAATELDDLLQRVEQFSDSISGPTAEMLRLAIAEVKDGVLAVEEFGRIYGDTMIDVENGKVALRELLQGMDPKQFRRRAQEIRKASLEFSQIMALLTELHNQAAEGLLGLMRLYEEGDVTWRRLLESAREVAEAAGEESQTGALAEQLAEYLQRNRRSRGGRL